MEASAEPVRRPGFFFLYLEEIINEDDWKDKVPAAAISGIESFQMENFYLDALASNEPEKAKMVKFNPKYRIIISEKIKRKGGLYLEIPHTITPFPQRIMTSLYHFNLIPTYHFNLTPNLV